MAESQLTKHLARIESMTNVDLRAELKQRGCPTSGNKKDLLAKLRTALEKEYQDNSAGLTQNEPADHNQIVTLEPSDTMAISAVPVISIPRVDVDSSISSTPERSTRTRSKRASLSAQTNDAPPPPAPVSQSVDNKQPVLDTSVDDNYREVNSSVSKSIEEKDSDVEHVGEKSHLSSLGDTSVEEVPLPDALHNVKEPASEQLQNDLLEVTSEKSNGHQLADTGDEKKQAITPVVLSSNNAEPTTNGEQAIVKGEEPPSASKEPEKITLPMPKPSRSQPASFTRGFNRSAANKVNLTSELLKTLIPDLSLASASMVNEELDALLNDDNTTGQPVNTATLETDVDNSEPMTIGDLADGKQPKNRTVVVDVVIEHDEPAAKKKPNPTPARLSSVELKSTPDRRSNTTIVDEPIRIKHPVAAQEPPSQILHIGGLTRPFSLFQLKELLSRYGTLVDGEFWLEKIKSQCFVTYNTLEEAQDAREALDGCRWPSTNPKTLSVRFGRPEELQFSKTHDLPPDQMSVDSLDRVMQHQVDVGGSHRSTNVSNGVKPQLETQESRPSKADAPAHSGFLIEEEEPIPVDEPPAKDLDDYFRKTKTKPYIYWLPLTEEQIIERQRRAAQRRAEREENAAMSETNSRQKRKRSYSPSRRR